MPDMETTRSLSSRQTMEFRFLPGEQTCTRRVRGNHSYCTHPNTGSEQDRSVQTFPSTRINCSFAENEY